MIELDRNSKILLIPQGLGQGSITVQTEGYTEDEMDAAKNKAYTDGKNSVPLESIVIDGNGIYKAENGGYKEVIVNTPTVDMEDKEFVCTKNGEFEILPPKGYDAMKRVLLSINVAGGEGPSDVVTITENGVYNVEDKGVADVQVPVGVFPEGELYIKSNGVFDVTDKETVRVEATDYPEPIGDINITENGTYDVKDVANAIVNVETGIQPSGTLLIDNQIGTRYVKNYEMVDVKVTPKQSLIDVWKASHLDLSYEGRTEWYGSEDEEYPINYIEKVLKTDYYNTGDGGFALYVNVHAGDTIRFVIENMASGDNEGLGWRWMDGSIGSQDYGSGTNIVMQHTYENDFQGWIGSCGYRDFSAGWNGHTYIKDWGNVANYCNTVVYNKYFFEPNYGYVTDYAVGITLINQIDCVIENRTKLKPTPKLLPFYGADMRMSNDTDATLNTEKIYNIRYFQPVQSINSTDGNKIMSKALICAKKESTDNTWWQVEDANKDVSNIISGVYIGYATQLTVKFTTLTIGGKQVKYRIFVRSNGKSYRSANGLTDLTKTIDLTQLGEDAVKYFVIALDGYTDSSNFVNFYGRNLEELGFTYTVKGL